MKRLTPVFVTLAIVLTLAACGGSGSGGGGGGGDGGSGGGGVITPPVAVRSIIASPAVLPSINGTTNVSTAVTTALSVEFTPLNLANPTAATFIASTGAGSTFTCGGVTVGNVLVPSFSIAQVAGTTKFVATSSFSVTGLPASSNCIFSLPLTITGNGVVSNPVMISFSFTTVAAPVCVGSSRLNSANVCIPSPGTVQDYTWNDVI